MKQAYHQVIIIFIVLLLFQPDLNAQLRIAVASSAKEALEGITEKYIAHHPDMSIEIISGSTGKMVSQISHGAPFHLLLAADTVITNTPISDLISTEKMAIYASGSLVFVHNHDITDLKEGIKNYLIHHVRKLAIASPYKAPYGRLASSYLEKNDLLVSLQEKLVFGVNVGQINQYFVLGSADALLTSKSSIYSKKFGGFKHWMQVPDYELPQAIYLTDHGIQNDPQASSAFYEYMLSKEVKKILSEYGYETN